MKKNVAAIVIILVIVLSGLGVWYFLNHSATVDGNNLEPILVGASPNETTSALIYIAQDQGFFKENGLNVTTRSYVLPVDAVHGMENGDVDVSVSSEYPFVGGVINKENISVIGCLDKYDSLYLVCRKDHGIENVSDLRGKKIIVSSGTIMEFYLGRLLSLNGISPQDVTLVNLDTSQMLSAIDNGSVDAMAVQDVKLDTLKKALGANYVALPLQNNQSSFAVMACTDDYLASHQDSINHFLRSLEQADEYGSSHPNETTAIIRSRLNYTDAKMMAIWPDHYYSLTLDQSLIIAMQDESRWMIANNLTTAKTLPDYNSYIYTKGLEEVKPEAVNIR
jgi:NitT/TauT family transport system substrate-binding protein